MTKLFVTFDTGPVPDDLTGQEEQDLARPVFRKLMKALRQAGVKAAGSPEKWDDYGWYAEFVIDDACVVMMLQRSDEWLVQVWPERGFFDRMKGRVFTEEANRVAVATKGAIANAFGVEAKGPMTEREFTA